MSRVVLGSILATDYRQLRNSMTRFGSAPFWKLAIGLFLIACIVITEFAVAAELFRFIMKQQYLEELRFVLLAKLLYMVFLIFFALLTYSNTVLSISAFFLSPEIDVLHARPLKNGTLFWKGFLETFLGASWMFIAFGIPIFVAYGHVLGQGLSFVSGLLLIVLWMLLIPCGIGVSIGITLISIFSPRQTQRVLMIIGVILAVGLVILFRWMRPEQLIDPIGVEQMAVYLETLRMPTIDWLPTAWASEGIASMGENRYAHMVPEVVRLSVVAVLTILAARTVYHFLWWRARSGGQGGLQSRRGRSGIRARKPTRFRMTLVYRDFMIFVRDPGQWTQMVVLAALFAIYVFNFKNLPYALYGFSHAMTYIAIAASGLIQAALLARFAFPAISTEGSGMERLRSTPISWTRYFLIKYMQHVIPAGIFGVFLVVFSLVILDIQGAFFIRSVILMIEISLASTALALTIGVRFPRFDLVDAAQVAVSTGGFIYMFSALSIIALLTFISAVPDLIRYFSFYTPRVYPLLKQFDGIGSVIAAALVSISVSLFAIRYGLVALNRIRTDHF